jgi:hypothetical protein
MSGMVDAELAKIVEGVHDHFIGVQLKSYIESGEHNSEQKPK